MRRTAAVIGAVVAGVSACGPGVRGTYSDATGAFVLDLKSGGKANFTIPGDAVACNYDLAGESLTLECPGDAGKLVFTIHGDGSMTGPRDGFMPALRKKS
jgi:hypothetical protein